VSEQKNISRWVGGNRQASSHFLPTKRSPEGNPLWQGFGGVPQEKHVRAGGWKNTSSSFPKSCERRETILTLEYYPGDCHVSRLFGIYRGSELQMGGNYSDQRARLLAVRGSVHQIERPCYKVNLEMSIAVFCGNDTHNRLAIAPALVCRGGKTILTTILKGDNFT